MWQNFVHLLLLKSGKTLIKHLNVCCYFQFQRQSYAKLKWFRSGKKGYGLQVLENISEGKFLIEYVGEVILTL